MTDQTPTPPALDLAALTVIANAATAGPWTAEPYSYGVQDGRIRVTSPSDSGIYNLAEDVTETDAAHIAAFDPPTVLALIARAEAAEAQVARVRELARAWAQRGEHTMKYAATCPEDVRETLHENGADMLDSARKVIAALDGTA